LDVRAAHFASLPNAKIKPCQLGLMSTMIHLNLLQSKSELWFGKLNRYPRPAMLAARAPTLMTEA